MHRIASALIAAVLALAPGAASAADGPQTEDRSFLLSAMTVSSVQAEAGRVAAERATDDRVRRFARAMAAYHQASHERLAEAARRHGMEPLRGLDPSSEHWMNRLGTLAGPRFDAVYMNGQEINLYAADYIYQRQGRFGFDDGLRREAARQAEDVDGHREEARRIAASLAAGEDASPRLEDETFLVYAMDVDRTQTRLGALAAEKAQDERVREFARHMIHAHGRSHDQLTQAARASGVEPPREIGPAARRMESRLRGLSGPRFDREYITSQVIHHDTWFYRYERETIHGRDERARALAAEGARMGKAHHRMAREIVDETG